MDNFKKVGLTALGTALVASTSYAGEVGVSGTMKMVLSNEEKVDKGNGWTMNQSLIFSGSSDLDNGWTVSYMQNVAAGVTGNATLGIDMGDMGTLSFGAAGVDGPTHAWDDVMPTANEETWHGITGAKDGSDGLDGVNSFGYTVSLMDGLSFRGGYQPSSDTKVASSVDYGIQYTGVEGLDVGLAAGENEDAANTIENTVMYAKYAIDSFTIGVQDNSVDTQEANADRDFRAYGISYAVSEDLSVSYGISKVEFENTSLEDQESTGISFSYTSGGVTVSATHNEMDNVAGTSTNDKSGYEINFAFAF